MFLVLFMLFEEVNFPFIAIELWEKGISLLRRVVHFSQAKAVRERECLGINACSTNDVNLFLCRTTCESLA